MTGLVTHCPDFFALQARKNRAGERREEKVERRRNAGRREKTSGERKNPFSCGLLSALYFPKEASRRSMAFAFEKLLYLPNEVRNVRYPPGGFDEPEKGNRPVEWFHTALLPADTAFAPETFPVRYIGQKAALPPAQRAGCGEISLQPGLPAVTILTGM